MFSIVHSTWIKELHSRSVRKRSSMECDFLENVADTVDKGPETQLMLGQIISVVELLPEAQRVVMLLVAMEGLSYQEAADVLEVPIGTVMSRCRVHGKPLARCSARTNRSQKLGRSERTRSHENRWHCANSLRRR
jgi:DNA-directed RNA polymerase specialized sigma24 family protein